MPSSKLTPEEQAELRRISEEESRKPIPRRKQPEFSMRQLTPSREFLDNLPEQQIEPR